MLIDRIDNKFLKHLEMESPGPIFYVNEKVQEYGYVFQKEFVSHDMNNMKLPQQLPFRSFIVHFLDGFITYSSKVSGDGFLELVADSFFISDSSGVVNLHGDLMAQYLLFVNLDRGIFGQLGIRNKATGEVVVFNDRNFQEFFNSGPDMILYSAVLMVFLSFLSCNNVDVEEVTPHEKVQKKRKKKKKPPLFSYYVLKVKGLKKNYKGGGPGGKWSNRAHLCRGHVREYTSDKPLFGKFVGRFWIPPHARGNRKLGAVQKDYALCT